MKQISDNEIYLLIKYIKCVLCRVAKRLSYIEDARCLKVNIKFNVSFNTPLEQSDCGFSWINKRLDSIEMHGTALKIIFMYFNVGIFNVY